MDRSLKWRFLALLGIVLFCGGELLPTFVDRTSLPDWFPFKAPINLGLDLQGGTHVVYRIDLDKAVDDRASDIKRDLDSRFTDDKTQAVVKTPDLGLVAVTFPDDKKFADIRQIMKTDYGKDVDESDPCPDDAIPKDAAGKPDTHTLCFKVSQSFADGIKRDALNNAVSTIRERINEKGVAEPSVTTGKNDDIIVELPGLDPDRIAETKEIISRTAKLEMKVVDDCSDNRATGCTMEGEHGGSPYMRDLYSYVLGDTKRHVAADPKAVSLGITADVESWRPEEGGTQHVDYTLIAHDRDEAVTVDEAKKMDCWNKQAAVTDGKIHCNVTGKRVIERYLTELGATNPKFKIPEDREIGYEKVDGNPQAKDQRPYWHTFYLDKAVRLTGSTISKATGSYDPNTNRPVVLLDFNRFGGRVFGEVTSQIVGMKFATILDGEVKSAPQINGAIRGGRAMITMGGGDNDRAEKSKNDLVAVLNTGSIVAPLKLDQELNVGATLGRDAIQKTRLSFAIGILLVVIIMVGIYRWSGWISVFAVVFHILMTLAVMAIFGATLTLPGIAAIVLSIGMEVDGNILIYERIRDELLLGKSVRGAIDLGFSRAFSAILDGQLTTAA
ncbi:MAG TPA: protein translocase subunit SecD, partial [Kofleriaceae bacterium]|nr:protein translocase subunit SecD [Kofleriaceae bacterium]